MLRFDPGFGRVRNARSFQVWEGGGEYNVARAMRKCWGKRATAVTALPVNDLGWLVEDLMMQGGVDASHVIWREFDGLGRNTRVGLNFTEKGFGVRAALGCSDRGHSAASQIRPGEVNWEKLFGEEGVRWFHTGGIFAALASNTAEAVIEAVEAAHKHGTIVSYDLNYRASLWKSQGGKDGAQKINRTIAPHVDVMIGNEEDFTACLGFAVEGLDEHISKIDPANFKKMIAQAVKAFPNFKVAATTLRNAKTASFNDWGAVHLRRRRVLRGAVAREPRNLRPGRRRRRLRLGAGLRLPRRQGAAGGGRIRRRARRAGDDHAGRHLDGQRQGSRSDHEGQGRKGDPVAGMSLFPSPGLFAAFVAASVSLRADAGAGHGGLPVAHLRRRPAAWLAALIGAMSGIGRSHLRRRG